MNITLAAHLSEPLGSLASPCGETLCVATPYLTQNGLDGYVGALGAGAVRGSRWLVCLSTSNAVSGFTDPRTVRRLLSMGAAVKTLDELHAKLYLLGDGEPLILGSANLTAGGLVANEEIVALVRDCQASSHARELFDSWWARGKAVTRDSCLALEREAERVAELQATATAMARLTGLGAFVTITTSPAATSQQRRKLDWKDVGVPRPTSSVFTPPTLTLWPKKVHDSLNRHIRACRKWVRRNTVRHEGGHFLPRELFRDLEATVKRANEQFESCLAGISPEDWRTHREELEQQVRSWLERIAKDQRRRPGWTSEKLHSIMRRVPDRATIGGEPTIIYRLVVPHPDNVPDLDGLINEVAALLQRHPIQTELPGLHETGTM